MVKSYTKILRFKLIVKVLTLLLIFNSSVLFSQSIFTNPITDADPSLANPYTNGQTFDAGITVSGIGRGTGITASSALNRYSASGWNSGAIDANDYYEFSLTPNAGCDIDFADFVYVGQVSSAGNPSSFAFRSSLDGFTANIGAPNATGTTIVLTAGAYQNITSAITFRLFGWGAGAAGNTWSINSFTFNGAVTCGVPNTITTGVVATSPFVLATCASTVAGTVAFTSTGTFNAGNIYTAQLSNSAGSFAAPVNIGTLSSTANSGSVPITIPAGTTSGAGYLIRVVANNPNTTGSNSAAFTITQNGAVQPTTQASSSVAGNLGCNSFLLNWVVGNGSNRLIVVRAGAAPTGPSDLTSYTANNTFGSGTALGGGFVVYAGTGNSVFVNGLSASTTYHWAIYEFNGSGVCTNYLTSTASTGNVTTTACSASAGITAVYVNSCDGACAFEGNNELIWANSGSYGMEVNSNGPTLQYNSTPTPTSTYISTYGINGGNITVLNTAVTSCTNTVFVDPNTLGFIPPNSTFLIANNCMCSPSSYDFSALCNSGPIYVVFGTNAAWPCGTTGGIFGNSGAGTRYFDLDFNAWGVALVPEYNYAPNSLIGGDGAIILLNPAGGAPTTYSNSGCIVPPIVLPIELIDFYATKNEDENTIVWKVASEINVVHYTIDKSNDGINFTELAKVFSNNDTQTKTYKSIDDTPFDDITYYRLGTKENDGSVNYHKIISVDQKSSDWDCYNYQQEQNLMIEFKNSVPKNSTIHLFDLSGKLLVEGTVKESQTIINTQAFAEGIYFLKISTPYKTENFKIIISK